MKKIIASACLVAIGLLSSHTAVQANPAQTIFNNIGMTYSGDPAGVMKSQSRTIYSFGGGMATARGKKVSLMAVDPPSVSAGCGGISWHFGGFAFISAEEIRQMIEAISQAALGVVIDLALSTLCPMCHSVMDKMRALANAARAMIADACRIAKKLGDMITGTGLLGSEGKRTECGTGAARSGVSGGVMDAQLDSVCDSLSSATDWLNKAGENFNKWLDGGNKAVSGGAAPTEEEKLANVNSTYAALTALGYPDGLAKDIILSSIGMAIYPAKMSTDCSEPMGKLRATDAADLAQVSNEVRDQILGFAPEAPAGGPQVNVATGAEGETKTTPAPAAASDASKTKPVCYAPPLLSPASNRETGKWGLAEVGKRLVCGFDTTADFNRFSTKFAVLIGGDVEAFKREFQKSQLAIMCGVKQAASLAGGGGGGASGGDENPLIYKCRKGCLQPEMYRLKTALGADSVADYGGVGWMVMDALYSGVLKVQAGDQGPLEDRTLAVLMASEFPLFRLMNMSAVYGDTATSLLSAYGARIATSHVESTLNRLLRPGALPTVKLENGNAVHRMELQLLRQQIDAMADGLGTATDQVKNRMAEKKALVDQIIQVNKALQADIMMTGLASNNQLAVSLKKQATLATGGGGGGGGGTPPNPGP